MKRMFCCLFAMLLMLSLCSVTAFAAEENDISKFELPAPQAPNYFIYTDGDASEGHHDDLRMLMLADPEVALLAAEYDRDSDAFHEKYGLWSFEICLQYDVSLDDENHWQHNAEWDTNYYTGGYADGYPYVCLRSEMMEDFEFFWLTYYEGEDGSAFEPYKPAITTYVYHHGDWDENIYSFDVENHSLYIRCRYYMEWEPLVQYEEGEGPGEKQSKFSDWSESAIFGKSSTQIIPDEPTVYEAPIISDMKIVLSEGDENSHIEYAQTTPESVWLANAYYMMMDAGEFEGLQTQVSINGGEWIEFDTVDSWGDWCLWNGSRSAYNFDVPIEEDSWVRLRVRFLGTHGPSPWSNVLEANGGGTQEFPDPTDPTEPEETKPQIPDCDQDGSCVLSRFDDVDLTDWYHDGAHFCVARGLMNGMSATTFEPGTNTSRAMLVTMLYRMEGQPSIENMTEPFTDVAPGDWFYASIVWAYNNGVVKGMSDTTFEPDTLVTREQVATIMHRYNGSPAGTGNLSGFPDVACVSGYAVDAMVWAVGEGMINGIAQGNGTSLLAPTGNATRAQIATILMRYLIA